MPDTPCGCPARQVSPVPAVPTGGGAHLKPSSRHAASSLAPQHCLVSVQRQKPASQTPDKQSVFIEQRTPGNCLSTPFASKVWQGIPVPSGEQALLDGVTRSARKFPSTSAMSGFSYHVQDERYWLKSTSPVSPSYT